MIRRVDDPKPGYFKMRLAKGCPEVGAELKYGTHPDAEDRSPLWETWINGRLVRDPSPDPTAAGVWRVWLHGEEIEEHEYRYLVADREWCATHAPAAPEATPDQPVLIANMSAQQFMPRKRS